MGFIINLTEKVFGIMLRLGMFSLVLFMMLLVILYGNYKSGVMSKKEIYEFLNLDKVMFFVRNYKVITYVKLIELSCKLNSKL